MEDASKSNSTEVIPIRNRGRPRGKDHLTAAKAAKPTVKGQLDKTAFKEWKLKLGKAWET